MSRPAKVAIIGGGCGGMTAAYELSKPGHGGAFEITLFQEGWRLGGKGASGRGPAGRIEEHGLHIWLGYYDNSFRMMRDCYAEVAAEEPAFGSFAEAFLPEPDIGLAAIRPDGSVERWDGRFPPRPGLPGDPHAGSFTLAAYTAAMLRMVETLFLDVAVRPLGEEADGGTPARLAHRIAALLERGVFAGALVVTEGLALLRAGIAMLPPALDTLLVRLADRLAASARDLIAERLMADSRDRHIWDMAEILIAATAGILRHGILRNPRGLDALDGYDCREFLRMNGASERAVRSPFVQGTYDLAFAHEGGDPSRPGYAAGVGLRGTMRLFFGYRGSIFWRMRAGMGDVVFAPLYRLLAGRGVDFRFFHRLTDVGLAGDGSHVDRLTFDLQARPVDRYDPLIRVKGRPSWPAEPRWSQLRDGRRLAAEGRAFESHWDRRRVGRRELRVGRDFDFVVLAPSIAAIPHVAPELIAAEPRWRAMVEKVATVATQAGQIWLSEDLPTLGWQGPPWIATAYKKPLDTFADMAHVIPEEDWPVDGPLGQPATALYFCSVLEEGPSAHGRDDRTYPARRAAEAKAHLAAHLEHALQPVFPGAYGPDGAFRWELLCDPAGAARCGPARLDTQYWRANVNPSERYVLSLPATIDYRISPLDRRFDNLTIAGDWTACGLNSGCTESAVISGMLAANAISGLPELEDIVGYDHP